MFINFFNSVSILTTITSNSISGSLLILVRSVLCLLFWLCVCFYVLSKLASLSSLEGVFLWRKCPRGSRSATALFYQVSQDCPLYRVSVPSSRGWAITAAGVLMDRATQLQGSRHFADYWSRARLPTGCGRTRDSWLGGAPLLGLVVLEGWVHERMPGWGKGSWRILAMALTSTELAW